MSGARALGAIVTAPFVLAVIGGAAWWYGRKLRDRLLANRRSGQR